MPPEDENRLSETLGKHLYKASDSTIYLPAGELLDVEEVMRWKSGTKERAGATKKFDYSYAFADHGRQALRRYLVCRCSEGRYWSVTVRSDNNKVGARDYRYKGEPSEFFQIGEQEEPSKNRFRPTRGHEIKCDKDKDGKEKWRSFLFSIHELSFSLYKQLLRANDKPEGLLVISGSTNAAKSQVARGIIYHHLLKLCKDNQSANGNVKVGAPHKRKPHLVTFEDPIENPFHQEFFFENNDCRENAPFDYTPRQKHRDVPSLEAAFRDALRQTPSVFFVGETRDPDDWEHLLGFAGTGHFVVTTTHAGSLLETVAKIFEAVGATVPGKRAEAANRIIGVVHLMNQTVPSEPGFDFDVTFPAIYRNTPNGVQNLISDGLSSILPYYRTGDLEGIGTLGRRAALQLLLYECALDSADVDGETSVHGDHFKRAFGRARDPKSSPVFQTAFALDLQGE